GGHPVCWRGGGHGDAGQRKPGGLPRCERTRVVHTITHLREEQSVYAQLVRSRSTDQKCAEVHRIVADELIPALHNQPGFAGALSLVNAPSGETIMIVLWHSAEQAQRALGANGTDVLAPLLR